MITAISRGTEGPFATVGVTRDADGVPRFSDLPVSLVAGLRSVVRGSPDEEAVVELGGERLTYAQLWDRASRVAGGLRAAGVQAGDTVAIRLPNGTAWVESFVGVLLAGAVAVPVNTRLAPPEVETLLDDARPSYVIDVDHPAPKGDPVEARDAGRDSLAAIFYTSGTTGRSKGATATHEAMLAVARTVTRTIGLESTPDAPLRTLVCIPLFHVTGCNGQLVPTLLSGGTVVIQRQLDVPEMLAALKDERITYLVAVPAIYFYLLANEWFDAAAFELLRWAVYGGAPIAPDLVARLTRVLPRVRVANGFGMSETSSLATLLPHEDAVGHADSVGYPGPAVDVGILDGDESSGVGEIVLRGQSVTRGYWRTPELNSEIFVDGWLKTGDVGRIDEAGRLYLVDRSKDIINRGGENVYSVEVENALADAPGVGEAAVVAVPDAMMGEKVGCVLVATGDGIDVAAVIEHVEARLADYKVPQFVAVRERPLPRNAGGKVLKHVLRDETTWPAPVR